MADPHFDQSAAKEEFIKSFAKSFNNPDTCPDILIKSGREEWLCHKQVLCRQSEWFQKACNGPFQESKSHTIELKGDNTRAVYSMLEYCYSFTYTSPTQRDCIPSPVLDVKIFALAEKYFIKDLAKLATDRFVSAGANIEKSTNIQLAVHELTLAIKEAQNNVYDRESLLRLAICNIVIQHASRFLNGTCLEFDALMDTHPSLAADVARELVRTWKAPVSDVKIEEESRACMICRKLLALRIGDSDAGHGRSDQQSYYCARFRSYMQGVSFQHGDE